MMFTDIISLMTCPNCENLMQLAKVPSANLGLFVQFNQCSNCGGLWFDRFDIAQIPKEEAFKIDILDEEKLQKVIPLKMELNCPKDNEKLTEIKEYGMPHNAQIYRCHKCEGIWLNKGELTEYKKEISESIRESEKIKEKEDIDRDKERVMSRISNQLMPLPSGIALRFSGGNQEQPFVLSSHAVNLLKEVPQEEKIKMINQMAQEHNQKVESENRFVDITMTVLNIIFRLMMRG